MILKNTLYLFAATSCAILPLPTLKAQTLAVVQVASLTASERLADVLDSFFENMQKLNPEFATYVGKRKDYNGLWTDHSEAGYFARYQMLKNSLEVLKKIDREALSSTEQLNYDLFERDLSEAIDGYRFQAHYLVLDQLGGIPLDVPSILLMMPKESVEDYQAILGRLSAIPVLLDQTLDLLQAGLEKGLTQPRVVLRTLPGNFAKMISPPIENSIFFQSFTDFPKTVSQNEQHQIVKQAFQVIEQDVYPAYAKLLSYLENTYIPACRETIATCDLPDGENLYLYNVKRHTTTTLTPKEIHQIGLGEVARIQSEMQQIINDINFSGSIADYFTYLHTSPEFFFTEPQSLIEGYKAITSYIDGQLPLLFGRLPKLPYEVVPVPSFSEESQVGAYYMRGSLATGRPGRFYANTYDIGSRPKWQMESLSLHEAVPGHHFQISIAQEIEGLPEFRKYNNYTAYIEGWGLYSESLGKELGLYKAPSDQFGRLIEEIWRAVRLVVDTGMHALGWTREDAIAYMMETTGMGEREVTTEIDRYIVWPGQALAYKVGELSIQKWRHEAQQVLGDKFDIRAFHDMLLEQGALPLDICEKYVHNWIETQK